MAKKTYIAKVKGYDGVKLRQAGEKFEFEGKKGKWMDEYKPSKAASKGKPEKPVEIEEDVI